MILITKIVNFETAHAIHGYSGACKNIHGHSYELHVTIASVNNSNDYIPAPGFLIDFKEIKNIVNSTITVNFDHKIILSKNFIEANPALPSLENIFLWDFEPTAENMLVFIKNCLNDHLPIGIKLVRLKLFETKNSYAEWVLNTTFNCN